jgi:hypothetical protein
MVLVSDKLSNGLGILQTKLSDRERYETRRVGLEAMPLDEDIEGRHGEGQARLKIAHSIDFSGNALSPSQWS